MRTRTVVPIILLCGLWTAASARAAFDTIIDVSWGGAYAPASVNSNTQLNVTGGGMLPKIFQAGPSDGTGANVEVNFYGQQAGLIHANGGSVVNLAAGVIQRYVFANEASVVNVSGSAWLYDSLRALGGSVVNVSGGRVDRFSASDGSIVNISGGTIEDSFYVAAGSVVTVSGGNLGNTVRFLGGSQVSLAGSDFQIDGREIDDLTSPGDMKAIDLPVNSVLSGTLADGTPFAFTTQDGDEVSDGTVILRRVEVPQYALGPILVTSDSPLQGVRAGQHITVENGGKLRNWFNAGAGSAVTLDGGTIDSYFEAVDTRVEILGGTIGNDFDAFHGTTVRILGGTVGANFGALNGSDVQVLDGVFGAYFHADAGSRVIISDGSFGRLFSALGGSSVTIRGGEFGERFYSFAGSDVTISGGTFGDNIRAFAGSNINFRGTEFLIDGVPIEGLDASVSQLITERDVMLSGVLADGTPFQFELNSRDYQNEIWPPPSFPWPFPYDFFDTDSVLSVTLVPESSSATQVLLALVGIILSARSRRSDNSCI